MTDEQPTDAGPASPPEDGPLYHGVETAGGWQLKPGQDAKPEGEPTEAQPETDTETDKSE